MRRADVRGRSHRRYMTRHRDEGAGRRGARSRRGDERDDRDARSEEARRDVIRRIDQPTRGIDDKDDRRRTVSLSLGDHAVDIAGGDRVDHTVDVADQDGRRLGREGACREPECPERDRERRCCPEREPEAPHSTILDPLRNRAQLTMRSFTGMRPISRYQSATHSGPYFARSSSTVWRRSAAGSVERSYLAWSAAWPRA